MGAMFVSNASQMLTMSLAKRLLGLEPVLTADPGFAAVAAKWHGIQEEAKRKRGCCGHSSITMNLVRELGEAIRAASPEAQQTILRIVGTQKLIGHVKDGTSLVKADLAVA